LEKVIRELKDPGIRLAIIKHDALLLKLIILAKDTWRHAQPGRWWGDFFTG